MALYQSQNSMPPQQVWNAVTSSLLGEGKSQAVWTKLHTFAPNALNNEIYLCTSPTQGTDVHTSVPIPTPHTSLTSALSHYVRTRFLVHAFLLQDTSFSYSVCGTV